MKAAKNGHDLCTRALLEAGAAVDQTEEDDWTALMFAAQNGHNLCVRALLEAGARINMRSTDCSTRLLGCCLVPFCFPCMLSGALPCCLFGQTALDLGSDHPEIVTLLQEHGGHSSLDEVLYAACCGLCCIPRRAPSVQIDPSGHELTSVLQAPSPSQMGRQEGRAPLLQSSQIQTGSSATLTHI